ncbi:MAG: cupin domain-containing protein [Chloroflexota bacterium]
MATKDQVIHNSSTGETIRFLLTSADTDGELLQFEDTLPANHASVPSHIHACQEETFTVQEGTFHAIVDGEAKSLSVGESLTIPAGVAHSFHSKQSRGVKVLVELRPALDYEIFFETLAYAGEHKRNIPLQIAVLTQELNLGFYLAGTPKPLQNGMFAVMAATARIMGYQAAYP